MPLTKERRAVQITTQWVAGHGIAPQFITTVIADDGTMWEMVGNGPWMPIKPLPQGPVAGGGE